MRLICRFRGHRVFWTIHPLYPPDELQVAVCLRCKKMRQVLARHQVQW